MIMKIAMPRATWMSVGLILTLVLGTPAVADDTELLVANPNSNGANKPNILFVLDSSGSMNTIERTQQPYDASVVYPGSCQSDQYYWTESSKTPECKSKNDSHIDKSQFLCAQGLTQMATAGLYKDTMAQYRKRRRDWRWERLASRDNGIVECEKDSGEHGEGITGEVYAQIGANLPPFTADPDHEIAWGSSPSDRSYTVFDPNYLNWYHDSPVTEMSRNEIVKAVTKNVLGSINNVNVGFMRFHTEQGGPVTRAVKDLDSSRASAISIVDKLPASGWTPLSETMYEAALYWHGKPAQFGQYSSTDIEGLSSSDPMTYKNPTNYACAKNFVVLLTDGAPTRDVDAYDRVKNLPSYTTTMGRSDCTGGKVDGSCLDDIAEYLSKKDISSTVPGDQLVTTYTIGFKVDLPLLKKTAENSGGQYYLAEDVKTLTEALTEIVASIFNKDVSFAAPSYPVNSFNRTQHLNDLYISIFRATTGVHWPGNVKKYTIKENFVSDAKGNPAVDPDTGFFADTAFGYWNPGTEPDGANVSAGGAVSQLPSPSNRNVYSNVSGNDLTATANHISSANAGSFILSDFGLTGVAGEPSLSDMIEWIRGSDVRDVDNDPSTSERRQMGDTLHSQPATIVYGRDDISGKMDVVVYAATNDGQLHALDGDSGEELWTFLPKELLPNMADLYYDETINYKQYGIDGDIVPVFADRNHNGQIDIGQDFVYLVFGMRRGGNNYYALDVTNKNAPKLKWIRNYPEFGQTWSTPVVTRIMIDSASVSSPDNAVLVIGAGYDTTHDQAAHPTSPDADGAGIFMLDLESGEKLWRAGPDASADLKVGNMTRAIPTAIRVLDMSGDGFADRMYAADLGGQVWRFDIVHNKAPRELVRGGVIARFGAEGTGASSAADTRRFFATPDTSMFWDHLNEKRYISVSVGSGYRAHPLDKEAADRFYSLRDPDIFNPLSQARYDTYPIAYDADLVDVAGRINVPISPSDRGWKFILPPNEKILAESRTFDDSIYFVSFEPEATSADPCQTGLSINRLYRVNLSNGNPVVDDLDILDSNNPEEIDAARTTELEQAGIAVRPMFLFPSPLDTDDCEGTDCAPPPIGCVGVECFDPGFGNNPVRTLWTQNGIE